MSFIRIAQKVGLSLDQIAESLASLPQGRTPTQADWTRLSRAWRPQLDEHIAVLQRLRDDLDSCIGCGCLSLRRCALYNGDDRAALLGPGPRYLLGDTPDDLPGHLSRRRPHGQRRRRRHQIGDPSRSPTTKRSPNHRDEMSPVAVGQQEHRRDAADPLVEVAISNSVDRPCRPCAPARRPPMRPGR